MGREKGVTIERREIEGRKNDIRKYEEEEDKGCYVKK